MNETEEQRERRISREILITIKFGWQHIRDSIFRSPSGSVHDLSAADLGKLPQIEKNNSFAVAKLVS